MDAFKKKHRPIHDILIKKRKKRERRDKAIRYSSETRTDLVELVTLFKRPFKIVTDAPMQRILQRAAAGEKPNGNAPKFTMYRLIKDVEISARQIRSTIKNEMEGRFIIVIVDIASKFGRSVPGICAQ